MGLIPSMFKNHLWDWSRRCPQVTYGIIPIYFSESVLGLIPLVSSSHQWDWSFRCIKIICGSDPWGVLKSPTRCRHSFINHNEGTSSRALWKWQHKYCQCPRACPSHFAIVPASLYWDILAGCLKMTQNHAVIIKKPASMSLSKVSRHCVRFIWTHPE